MTNGTNFDDIVKKQKEKEKFMDDMPLVISSNFGHHSFKDCEKSQKTKKQKHQEKLIAEDTKIAWHPFG